jgi:AraC family transcriptional activator of pobA
MNIETYNFRGDEIDSSIVIEKLDQKTKYDFSKPHRHNYNELFFFTKGNGKHLIDFKDYYIEDCSVHIVSSNKIHKVIRDNKSYGYVILFKNDFLANNDLDLFFLIECEKVNLTKVIFNEQLNHLKKIDAELTLNNPLKHEVTSAYLKLLLISLKQFVLLHNKANLSNNEFYKTFYNLLEKNYKTQRVIKYYADELNIGVSVLNTRIFKITGKTSSRLIKDRVLLETKRLLLDVSLSIKEISYLLNFTDVSHFSKFFKNETSLTPSGFRAKIKMYHKN